MNEWLPLPCEGGVLERLVFRGHGKRSELTIVTKDRAEVRVPLSRAAWDLRCEAPLVTRMREIDDLSVSVEVSAAEPGRAVLAEARVFDCIDDRLALTSRLGGRRVELTYATSLRLTIVAA